jgi:hypothetical protein
MHPLAKLRIVLVALTAVIAGLVAVNVRSYIDLRQAHRSSSPRSHDPQLVKEAASTPRGAAKAKIRVRVLGVFGGPRQQIEAVLVVTIVNEGSVPIPVNLRQLRLVVEGTSKGWSPPRGQALNIRQQRVGDSLTIRIPPNPNGMRERFFCNGTWFTTYATSWTGGMLAPGERTHGRLVFYVPPRPRSLTLLQLLLLWRTGDTFHAEVA